MRAICILLYMERYICVPYAYTYIHTHTHTEIRELISDDELIKLCAAYDRNRKGNVDYMALVKQVKLICVCVYTYTYIHLYIATFVYTHRDSMHGYIYAHTYTHTYK